MAKILLVDDEPDILQLLSYNLAAEGYQLETARNGRKAIEKASVFLPDLIILDLMMPEMDGIEACAEIRKIPELKHCTIAFLTARSEDHSQIAGLEAGADDYITKPIKPKVLISKVKALLRRTDFLISDEMIKLHGLTIDREKYVVRKGKDKIDLPKKEFELLALLASAPGKVFTREHILSNIWGSDVIVGDRTIDVHIRKLREKLGNHLISTVKGVGYKITEE